MITEAELHSLLADLESDRVERTISTSNTDKFAQAVCAFANDFPAHCKPGYLLIGVKDDGQPSGLKVNDDLLQTLGSLRSDGNIQPMPALAVSRFPLPAGDVAVVEVLPADLPPVRYNGRVYIRVGPRRATATEQEERILTERRISHALTFDALPCLDSSLADLSEDRFRLTYLRHAVSEEVIAENGRPLKQQLASLRERRGERGRRWRLAERYHHVGASLFGHPLPVAQGNSCRIHPGMRHKVVFGETNGQRTYH